MKVGLLTQWANRANGGVFEVVAIQAQALATCGIEPHVFAIEHPDDAADASRLAGIKVTRVPLFGPRKLGFGKGLLRKLIDADLDVLHLHGIWTYHSALGAAWAGKTGKPYVISTHGMLDPWLMRGGRLKKAVGMAWFERRSWRAATAFHGLTATEARNIQAVVGREAAIVIPNGIDVPQLVALPGPQPVIVCIARLHAVKNLPALLEGWRIARGGERGWKLVMAGWGTPAEVARFEAALGPDPEAQGIRFLGPVFGDDKQRLLESAHFVVLPSLSEAMAITVLEAWALGIPSVMSDMVPLPEGVTAGAAIVTSTTPNEIAFGLDKAMSLDRAARDAMGRAAREVVIRSFSAAKVARRWEEIYRALVRGEPV
jgi:glycosyltransferase involved in cell wall biosynthesis